MGLNRYAKKRDANEREIILALEKEGVRVFQQDRPADLACYHLRIWSWLEVKGENGKLTEEQRELADDGAIIVVRSVEDALRALAII